MNDHTLLPCRRPFSLRLPCRRKASRDQSKIINAGVVCSGGIPSKHRYREPARGTEVRQLFIAPSQNCHPAAPRRSVSVFCVSKISEFEGASDHQIWKDAYLATGLCGGPQ